MPNIKLVLELQDIIAMNKQGINDPHISVHVLLFWKKSWADINKTFKLSLRINNGQESYGFKLIYTRMTQPMLLNNSANTMFYIKPYLDKTANIHAAEGWNTC